MNLIVLFLGFFLLPIGLGMAGYSEGGTRPYTVIGLLIALVGVVVIVVGTQLPDPPEPPKQRSKAHPDK